MPQCIWNTRLTELIDIHFPIIQAPMAGGATTPELIAAVSNAGGLGSLGAGYMSANEIRNAVKAIRKLTNKAFMVNLFIHNPYNVTTDLMQNACHDIYYSCRELDLEITPLAEPYAQSFEEQISVLVEEKIPVFSSTFGMLDEQWIEQFKKNHTIIIGTATTVTEARLLEKSGVDLIVAQGSEAGGHRGTFIGKAEDALIGLFNLIPQLIDQIKIPIIASGGIMNGRGIKAFLDLGADAVQMGTAFLTCFETGIPNVYKQVLLNLQADNTVLTRAFSGKLARGIRNQFTERMRESQANILDYPVQNALTNKMRKKAKELNNSEFMSMWAGQSVALCRSISANDLINILVHEAEELISARKNA
jgi:nitronate monooxygenase